jgi:hypothetical protein
MRRGQGQQHGSSDRIEVTRDDVARAKQAVNRTVWVLGLSSVATATAGPVAKCTEQQAVDDRHVAELTELKATNAELKATNAELKATNAELEARITET